ncbi:flap endonuclease GEN [Episyrphus balteatus]|uniref:flap endonuclease GEN n=1 Tax=Episyrphus balteatus TaxID=286459 RepID=UPI0024850224|nr:flap endonuclease GEN [Episyrphus balteatus]
MGIKELWSILTPYCERKPFYELRGKTVAIDLAGWVCESLNVVDYFVHPRQHLKNLFFRTCYLIWEDVTPVFVLEGTAPKLKADVMAKRNEIQFRGVKPKEPTQTQTDGVAPAAKEKNKEKGRTRFNHVLKQCENLLMAMGITCVQGPGEAEAYCAFLNKKGLVDGVISQDSDCFAYGALKVYRNFSVSTQGTSSASGGAVDVYDMNKICKYMDFGQNKIIVMGLLCGCDYCPDGVGGVGRDGVLKLFQRYSNDVIISRLKSWKQDDHKYTSLELKVDDKSICSNCGHIGKTASHTKSGCGSCGTHRGCDSSRWKEERLSLKSELALRKKAMLDPGFPSQEIIDEFLREPDSIPKLDLRWKQPNVVKFIKQIAKLLQWQEVYCFQKFFPLLTRWQVRFIKQQPPNSVAYVVPEEIVKKRTVKGVPSLEVRWKDQRGFFHGLIPDNQLEIFATNDPKGIQDLWTSVEPFNLMEESYPELVSEFLASKEKPKKVKKPRKVKSQNILKEKNDSLNNLDDLLEATNEVAKSLKPKKAPAKPKAKKGLQMIDKFFVAKNPSPSTQSSSFKPGGQCSTPKNKHIPSDMESDDEDDFDMSGIIDGIIKNSGPPITKHNGHLLHYEPVKLDRSVDDLDLIVESKNKKRNISWSILDRTSKKFSLDDSIDVLLGGQKSGQSPLTHVDRFLNKNFSLNKRSSLVKQEQPDCNTSYFFGSNCVDGGGEDEFERSMDISFCRKSIENEAVVISSDSCSD